MRLLRLHVENFGVLQDFRMEFDDALNVLHEENGWGKSTLAMFIKAMLYGLPAGRGNDLDKNDRKRYTPWQGGAFGGSLEFESEKGRFRVERFFAAKESGDEFALYDLDTNKESRTYSATLGEELFGIDADGFERTVYLSQRVGAVSGDNNSITAKLSNLLDDVDDIGSYDDAMAALDKRRQYYVKTGQRGRIAELEQERAARQSELEDLERVRIALGTKKDEIIRLKGEIASVQTEWNAARAAVQRAGAVRERAAHVEQKQRMQGEIAELETHRATLDGALGGVHPTDAALTEQNALLNDIRDANARLEAVLAGETPHEPTTLLPREYEDRCPDATVLSKMVEENAALQKLERREEILRGTLNSDAVRRFAKGVPSDAQLASLRQTLQDAQRPHTAEKPQGGVPVVAIMLLAVGIVFALLSFLPVGVPYLFPALAAVTLIASAVSFVLFGVRRKRVSRMLCTQAEEERRERERALSSVKTFLASYGMPTSGDLQQNLNELAFRARQYREEQSAVRAAREELEEIGQKKQQSLAFLQSNFPLFGLKLPVKNDYRDEIDALLRDLERIERAKNAAESRRRASAEIQAELASLKQRMLPFLMRYDPEKRHNAAQTLRTVTESEQEYRRICAEIERRQRTLADFVREKGLTETDEVQALPDDKTLIARERALQTRLDDLKTQQSQLTQQIENLSQSADRISDVQAQILRLDEEYAEAKANAKTIDNVKHYLETAKTALSTRYLDDMQKSFAHFLDALTAGESLEPSMDTSFDISWRAVGKTRTAQSFSRGWRDAVQFCVRLSLTDALYKEGEKPFLLLDDPFVNLDDRRLAAAKHLLETLSQTYQIVYMVCHGDRV